MQHFDLNYRYNILITISHLLKFLFREPRFHPSSPSSPFPSLSRLKTLEFPIEPPAHLAFFAFEVPDPDVFDTVICFNSASSSSELITISSRLSAVHRTTSSPFAPEISSLDWANSSPSTLGSNRRNCADSGSRSSPSLPLVSTLSPWCCFWTLYQLFSTPS